MMSHTKTEVKFFSNIIFDAEQKLVKFMKMIKKLIIIEKQDDVS